MIQLWTINRVLRWTGLRLAIDVWDGEGEREPTRIGFRWYGLPGSDGWHRIELGRVVAIVDPPSNHASDYVMHESSDDCRDLDRGPQRPAPNPTRPYTIRLG